MEVGILQTPQKDIVAGAPRISQRPRLKQTIQEAMRERRY